MQHLVHVALQLGVMVAQNNIRHEKIGEKFAPVLTHFHVRGIYMDS